MQDSDWKSLRFFTKDEAWGDPETMNLNLLHELDNFREHIQTPITVTCGTQGEHVKDSEHYKGRAADLMFPKVPLKDLPNIYLEALRFKFMGLGLYSGWKLNGKTLGGLHLDVRPSPTRALWLCTLEDSKPKYVALTVAGIAKAFQI